MSEYKNFCGECGTRANGSKFCENCGENLQKTQSKADGGGASAATLCKIGGGGSGSSSSTTPCKTYSLRTFIDENGDRIWIDENGDERICDYEDDGAVGKTFIDENGDRIWIDENGDRIWIDESKTAGGGVFMFSSYSCRVSNKAGGVSSAYTAGGASAGGGRVSAVGASAGSGRASAIIPFSGTSNKTSYRDHVFDIPRSTRVVLEDSRNILHTEESDRRLAQRIENSQHAERQRDERQRDEYEAEYDGHQRADDRQYAEELQANVHIETPSTGIRSIAELLAEGHQSNALIGSSPCTKCSHQPCKKAYNRYNEIGVPYYGKSVLCNGGKSCCICAKKTCHIKHVT